MHVVDEVVKIRKIIQEHNIQLVKDKEHLKRRLSQVQKECKRLQRKEHALDGIAALDEAARRI